MKILYLSRECSNQNNGATQVMKRNKNALLNIVPKEDFKELILPQITIANVAESIIFDTSYAVPKKFEKTIISIAETFSPDFVFIDGSSYGSICKSLKNHGFKTIVFAHNLDTSLCKQELKSRSPLISYPKYWSTKRNERKSSEYADILICLTERDSKAFQSQFNRKADVVLPITFPLRNFKIHNDNRPQSNKSFLFVGSDFFPNIEGIEWFIKHVAPFVDADFRIVGSCCDNPTLKNIDIPPNVTLVGYADDIVSEYMSSTGVIAPIFKGSGMKTKTVEALSYAKSIFGTSEAFAGIDCDYSQIGGLCNTQNDFIKALSRTDITNHNSYSENLFERKYSNEVFQQQLSELFYKLC